MSTALQAWHVQVTARSLAARYGASVTPVGRFE